MGHLFRSNRFNNKQRTFGTSLHDIYTKSPSTTPILTRRVPLLGGTSSKISEHRLIKQTSLQLKQEYAHQPLYDSPPLGNCFLRNNLSQHQHNLKQQHKLNSNASADYNTINSDDVSIINTDQNNRESPATVSIFSRVNIFNNNLEGVCDTANRHMPVPSTPPLSLLSLAHNAGSRLPQITTSGNLQKQKISGLPSLTQNQVNILFNILK